LSDVEEKEAGLADKDSGVGGGEKGYVNVGGQKGWGCGEEGIYLDGMLFGVVSSLDVWVESFDLFLVRYIVFILN
jgi:hypothetical protein